MKFLTQKSYKEPEKTNIENWDILPHRSLWQLKEKCLHNKGHTFSVIYIHFSLHWKRLLRWELFVSFYLFNFFCVTATMKYFFCCLFVVRAFLFSILSLMPVILLPWNSIFSSYLSVCHIIYSKTPQINSLATITFTKFFKNVSR